MTTAQKASLSSFDDETARKEEMKHLEGKKRESQIASEVQRLRQNKDKVAEMRNQDQLRTQMDMMNKSGNQKLAAGIAARLDASKDAFGRPVTNESLIREQVARD